MSGANAAYPYRYRLGPREGAKLDRKGQLCKLIKNGAAQVMIEFEDGFRAVVFRNHIHRADK